MGEYWNNSIVDVVLVAVVVRLTELEDNETSKLFREKSA
jgi:hypothetical protein